MGSSHRPLLRRLRSVEEPDVDEQQLSWLVIKRGWRVVSSDGTEIGYVEQVVGDSDEDVFNGLSISLSFFDEPRK